MSEWEFRGKGTGYGQHRVLDLGILELHVHYRSPRPRGYWWRSQPGFYASQGRHDDTYGNFKHLGVAESGAEGWAYERLLGSLCLLLRALPADVRVEAINTVVTRVKSVLTTAGLEGHR